jgi:hypothetical protein
MAAMLLFPRLGAVPPRRAASPVLLWLMVSACSGQISNASSAAAKARARAQASGQATAGNAASSGGRSGGGPSSGADAGAGATDPSAPGSQCGSALAPLPAPIARLTDLEYRNTISDLFPAVTAPALQLPPDNVVEGFDNNAKAQTPSPSLIEQYRINAQAIAAAVLAKLGAVLPCQTQTATAQQQIACGQQLIDDLAPRAYRRPLQTDERDRLLALFSAARSAYDFQTAVSMVIQGVLQAPQFLYRVELGGPVQDGAAQLTAYELASRLSYFFWDTMPDAELRDAAALGALDDAAGVETQARRLLADPRAHAAVASFHRQWLRFEKMDGLSKNPMAFPAFDDQVAASMRASATQFVEHVFWEQGGSLQALLTDSSAFVDANLAPLYGVPAPSGSGLSLVKTDATQRSGILTQVGLMAGFAHELSDSPVLRGVFVMDRFFCAAPPPPPPGVVVSVPMEDGSMPQTTRDRFAMTHESGSCAGCHHTIDGFGFGFEHYDAVGKWRDAENGVAINAKGWINGTRDADGAFDGAVELGQRMAKSSQVSQCVATQWFRYALGLGAADVDECSVAPVVKALADSHGDLREVLIATAKSDAFRKRPAVMP